MDVETAISLLSGCSDELYPYQKVFAAAYFSGWINAPDEAGAANATALAALGLAVEDFKSSNKPIPSEWITDALNTSYLLEYIRNTSISLPICWHNNEFDGYNNHEYVSDIVRFLLSYKDSGTDKRKSASLSKAWEFINKHGGFANGKFRYDLNYHVSYSQHQIVWRYYKQTAEFQFVRFFHGGVDWILDPRERSFLGELINLCSKPSKLESYFGMALHAQHRLRAVIDSRSIDPSDWVRFPADLSETRFRVPPIPPSAYDKMRSYQRRRVLNVLEES